MVLTQKDKQIKHKIAEEKFHWAFLMSVELLLIQKKRTKYSTFQKA